jgi:hypothetical protein
VGRWGNRERSRRNALLEKYQRERGKRAAARDINKGPRFWRIFLPSSSKHNRTKKRRDATVAFRPEV